MVPGQLHLPGRSPSRTSSCSSQTSALSILSRDRRAEAAENRDRKPQASGFRRNNTIISRKSMQLVRRGSMIAAQTGEFVKKMYFAIKAQGYSLNLRGSLAALLQPSFQFVEPDVEEQVDETASLPRSMYLPIFLCALFSFMNTWPLRLHMR